MLYCPSKIWILRTIQRNGDIENEKNNVRVWNKTGGD